jgi:di/tripeptidase
VKILLRDFSADGMQRRKDLLRAVVSSAQVRHPRASIRIDVADQYKNTWS